MCCVAKIYTSILNTRLQRFLELNDLLVEEQNGFRAARSCLDHILVLCTILRNRISLGLDTFLTFVDFQKAFDSVNRNMLLFKLLKLGINGNFYRAISAMYNNPKARVILNSHETDCFSCPIGVKQGDSISATLFAIFINDLAQQVKESGVEIALGDDRNTIMSILLYADDSVLMAADESDL